MSQDKASGGWIVVMIIALLLFGVCQVVLDLHNRITALETIHAK